MKLAFLSDAIYPFHHGGKETLQHERAVRLARRGHTVRVYTMHWWPERASQLLRDGVVHDAIAPRVPLYTARGRSIWESVVMGLASLQLLWSPDFDVLDVDQFPFTPFFAARLVCWLRRRPMIATWYEVWDQTYWRRYMGWLGPVGWLLQRLAARSADFIVADSKLTAARLTAWLDIDPRRVLVLAPGVSAHSSSSPPEKGSGGGYHKTIDCIFIGRLLAHKHVDILLRALAKLPGVTGLIIGSGPEKPRLLALSKTLGLTGRVSFESPADRTQVLQRLAASRLYASLSTREGFGVAVLEANACAVPALVVAHPDNAATELVEDGLNGFVSVLDADAIADQIRRYLADPTAQARMGEAALANAERYSWDRYVSRWEAAVGALVSSPLAKAA